MPEFILNKPRAAHPFYDLDTFAKGYVEAMFFTNGDTGDDNENLLNHLGTERLTKAAVARIAADCALFQKRAAVLLRHAYRSNAYDEEQAGRDFWLTRQGHGAGFWDREVLERRNLGRKLSDVAQRFGEAYVETNRGWIYVR